MKPLLRRLLFISLGLVVLVVFFYAEEDWRGWQAWQKCQREFAAKGMDLNWNDYIPPSVPDDQNFFKAPKMQEWFVRDIHATSNEFAGRLRSADTTATNLNKIAATRYLAWSDQFEPDFDLIREALKRPYARMDGDYSIPSQMPVPNFVNVRIAAQTLAQRAKCDLLLGRPEQALREVTLMHDLCRLLQAAPTGKPMTLVAAMINVAVSGLYVDTIADGFQRRAWQEPQLVVLQKQLAEINLTPFVFNALQEEPASLCRTAEIIWIPKMFDTAGPAKWTERIRLWRWWFWPSGWTYQNMVNVAMLGQKPLAGFDLEHDTVSPRKFADAAREVDRFLGHKSPYKILAAIAIPNFSRAEQSTARNQMIVNEAQIACALERYHFAHSEYPDTLDMLMLQFIEKIPHDIIGGEPLNYRPTEGGKYLLYSVGWNEKDDGGLEVKDIALGDWVWKN